MDVGDWLRSLGLAQYEAVFRDNGVEVDVLVELSDSDLEKLGVLLGHRRRMQRAIANLGAAPAAAVERAAQPAPPEPVTRPVPTHPAVTVSAERRHLTVMFCDLVGSTGISAKLDAEDWRDLVGGYLDAASAAVTRMGGHVAKKLGDGIMALFGYPLAQENDAERALRAALEIQRALAEINAKNASSGRPKLEARIGVETSAVVVDSQGEVFGDAPNVAARVQAAAEPGSVWTTGKVRRQVAGLFVAEDRGAHELKGVPEPTTLYCIVRASGGGRRSGQRALTPLIGREEELTMLLRRWERARAGEGQFLQIVAEPGLGKSRLIEEFRVRLVDTPHTWIEWASSQLLQNTPLHPIADWGRQRFGGADIPAERRLADLAAALQAVKLDASEHVPLLAPLLDMPLPEDRAAKLAPEELRRRQMAAMQAWVTAGARAQPIVLAFEDLHWADPTTLDLMKGLAERGALAPLFVVATTRPEFRAPWGARSHHGTITLTPLDRREVARMVAELAAKHAFSQAVVEGVNERTGGVPLFVEEVTRLLLERGAQDGAQAIPPTLQQSLAARLDRLGPAREVAMIGAVLGRGFSYPLLRVVAGMEEAPLREALEKLADADILLVEGLPPQAEYRFKHALIQDAAYENLLKSRRQALHCRAAETLRDQFPERAAAQPEVLAHHFTEAGISEAAIDWWGRAGDSALRRSAFPEAIAHLGKAIEMADKWGGAASNPPAPTDQRLKLQTSYGQAMGYLKGFAAEETKATLAQTLGLAAQSGNVAERMKAHYAQWIALYTGGELESAHEAAEGFLREAKLAGDAPSVAYAARVLGQTCLFQGRFAEAREHLSEALRVYSPGWDASVRRQLGSDAGIGAKAFLAMVVWHVGDAAGAAGRLEAALTEALASEHVPTIANNFLFKAMHDMARGDAEATLAGANVVLDVAEKSGLRLYESAAHMLLSWAKARLGAADGLARFRGYGETAVNRGRSALRPVVSRSARGTRSRADIRR
jgi:class 3 adenylate cyclase/tetratricopeptide (TPR) repeat protein